MTDLKPLQIPNGETEIAATFGDIRKYIKISQDKTITLDPLFERKYIVRARLPLPIRLAWDRRRKITTIKCHVLLAERFQAVFEQLGENRLLTPAFYYGGCYNFRLKRNRLGLSTHSWGIAIDINPDTNKPGVSGEMAPEIVAIFKGFSFIWGGDWVGATRDPMHFQYCTGY